MSVDSKFKLGWPELEAEIYYLTPQEGGRSISVHSGYRGQFYYDNHDYDVAQELIGTETCEPGNKVKVLLQTTGLPYHIGKFYEGKEFEIREGARIVGKGVVTKILRDDFNYWDGNSFLQSLDKSIKPYTDPDDLLGFRMDFDVWLPDEDGQIIAEDIEFEMTGKPECMMIIKAKAITRKPIAIMNYLIPKWVNNLALNNHLYKIDSSSKQNANGEFELEYFKLSFATWSSIYLTGEIIVS